MVWFAGNVGINYVFAIVGSLIVSTVFISVYSCIMPLVARPNTPWEPKQEVKLSAVNAVTASDDKENEDPNIGKKPAFSPLRRPDADTDEVVYLGTKVAPSREEEEEKAEEPEVTSDSEETIILDGPYDGFPDDIGELKDATSYSHDIYETLLKEGMGEWDDIHARTQVVWTTVNELVSVHKEMGVVLRRMKRKCKPPLTFAPRKIHRVKETVHYKVDYVDDSDDN